MIKLLTIALPRFWDPYLHNESPRLKINSNKGSTWTLSQLSNQQPQLIPETFRYISPREYAQLARVIIRDGTRVRLSPTDTCTGQTTSRIISEASLLARNTTTEACPNFFFYRSFSISSPLDPSNGDIIILFSYILDFSSTRELQVLTVDNKLAY